MRSPSTTPPGPGQTLTASVSDLDGATDGIGYQWFRDGNLSPVPPRSASPPCRRTLAGDLGRRQLHRRLRRRRGTAQRDTVNVANVNDAGSISIDDTTPTQGQTLTASINDADGAGPTSYQWYADGIAISGATNSSYTRAG